MTDKRPLAVAIDSDGCVFDNMTLKHRFCFGPALIETWKLHAVAESVQAEWEKINLFSATRGINRFLALLAFWESYPDSGLPAGVGRPDISRMRQLAAANPSPSPGAIKVELEQGHDAFLAGALEWCERVNQRVAQRSEELPAFEGAVRFIQSITAVAKVYVVSSANSTTIRGEWTKAGLNHSVEDYVTQERCSKKDCLRGLIDEGYQTLMVGDSPGDLLAARGAGSDFFPITPGHEEASWNRLLANWKNQGVEGVFCAHKEATDAYVRTLGLSLP